MKNAAVDRELRRVRVRTTEDVIEGDLEISPRLRTLDQLNRWPRNFLRVRQQERTTGINPGSILWVEEVTEFDGEEEQRVETRRFGRVPVVVRVAAFELRGFLHVPGSGEPITRLNRDRNDFVALTSVALSGPDTETTAPFVALSRAHLVSVAELVRKDTAVDDLVEEFVGTN